MAITKIFKAFNISIASDFDLELPIGSGPADAKILSKEYIKLPDLKLTKISRAGCTALFGSEGKSKLLHWPGLITFEIVENHTVYYSLSSEIAPGLIRVFLISEVLGILLFKNNFVFLHGSAVNVNGYAHVFVGLPGAGKSTTIAAFAKQKFEVLSDDLVLICFENDKPYVVPSFPEIKIWEQAIVNLGLSNDDLEPAWEGKKKYILRSNNADFNFKKIPLKQINILDKSLEFSSEISKIMTPIVLMQYFPLPEQLLTTEYNKRHFEMSYLIAKNVKLLNFARPKGFESLQSYINGFII